MSRSTNSLRRIVHLRRAGCFGILLAVVLGSVVEAAVPRVNEPAPDFALKSSTGQNLRLSEYRGDVVLLNFWTKSCGSCREQLDQLEQLYTEHRGEGFSVLSVAIINDIDHAQHLADEFRLSFPILFDDAKVAAKLYDPTAIPLTVLIDPSGQVRFVHAKYKRGDAEIYRQELLELLSE